jgi:DNA-binding GntR family transcriptional regulator
MTVLPSHLTRSSAVTEQLRQEVLQGLHPPGARLRQVEIAERFGVSTTPVREAFATLAQEGLVLRDSHRGVIVFAPSPDELQEIYEIRMVLEPLATELAAPRIADVDLDQLDSIIDEMRRTADRARRDELNRVLHASIYSHAKRGRLGSIIDQLRDTASVYLRFLQSSGTNPSYRAEADNEHQKIVDALRRRDGAAAAEAMREHLQHSQHHIEAAILDEGNPLHA